MSAESQLAKFSVVLDHLHIVDQVVEKRLADARKRSDDQSREGLLAHLVAQVADDIETDLEVELGNLLDSVKDRGKGSRPYRWDAFVVRGVAYAIPVLAAARLWKRKSSEPRRKVEVAEVIARTAIWLLGRAPLPDLASLMRSGKKGGANPDESCKLVGLWISRLGLARAIPSVLGSILFRGLDYFGLWATAAVANRYYDDMKLTLEESMEIAQSAMSFKLALVTALVRTARADGRFTFEEEEMLRLFLDQLAFSETEKTFCLAQAQPAAKPLGDDIFRTIQLPAHRRFIVARAVEMAFADRRESRSEKDAVRQIAKALGVAEKVVREHEEYMRALNETVS